MRDQIRLETDEAIVEVLPRLGGGITAFDLKRGDARVSIFRPWTGEWENPRALGSSSIAPWFNRISGGGFSFGGVFYEIAPNDPLEPVPLHGDAWYSPWEVIEQGSLRVALRLRSQAIPPFDYEAEQVISLRQSSLDIALSVTHRGAEPIPYGLGQHPWFLRTPGVTLWAPASGAWLEQPPDFPEKREPEPVPEKWDFSAARHLPTDFIDNGFAGWNGRARIDWADRGVVVDIEADPETHYYHVFSPEEDCPYFCFEPVTHPNNAFAKPGGPEASGLRVLKPGESTSLKVRLAARARTPQQG